MNKFDLFWFIIIVFLIFLIFRGVIIFNYFKIEEYIDLKIILDRKRIKLSRIRIRFGVGLDFSQILYNILI